MSDNVFQPAIDALEKDLADLELKVSGLVASINLLRSKVGLPPRASSVLPQHDSGDSGSASPKALAIHSDAFTGKKLGPAVREYLNLRKSSGLDAPATSREIFDALKQGGFASGAKDDATALIILRTILRKDSKSFVKLPNGKYALRSWYPNLRQPKNISNSKSSASDSDESSQDENDSADEETADSSRDEPAE